MTISIKIYSKLLNILEITPFLRKNRQDQGSTDQNG